MPCANPFVKESCKIYEFRAAQGVEGAVEEGHTNRREQRRSFTAKENRFGLDNGGSGRGGEDTSLHFFTTRARDIRLGCTAACRLIVQP